MATGTGRTEQAVSWASLTAEQRMALWDEAMFYLAFAPKQEFVPTIRTRLSEEPTLLPSFVGHMREQEAAIFGFES